MLLTLHYTNCGRISSYYRNFKHNRKGEKFSWTTFQMQGVTTIIGFSYSFPFHQHNACS